MLLLLTRWNTASLRQCGACTGIVCSTRMHQLTPGAAANTPLHALRTTLPHSAAQPLPHSLSPSAFSRPPHQAYPLYPTTSPSVPRSLTLPHNLSLCGFLCLSTPVPPLRLASYHAEEPGDLSCCEGEIFHLLADEGEGWVRVARAGGDMAEGILPLSYLTETVTTAATDTRPGPGKPSHPTPQLRSPAAPQPRSPAAPCLLSHMIANVYTRVGA